jgi:hypothetical protein
MKSGGNMGTKETVKKQKTSEPMTVFDVTDQVLKVCGLNPKHNPIEVTQIQTVVKHHVHLEKLDVYRRLKRHGSIRVATIEDKIRAYEMLMEIINSKAEGHEKIVRGPIEEIISWPNAHVVRAMDYATQAHAGQKYGNDPYIKHCDDVYKTLLQFKIKNPKILAAGWLHDTIEDTPATYEEIREEFGPGTADIVFALTGEGTNRKERNANAYLKISLNPAALIVKLADRISNVKSCLINHKRELYKMYEKEWEDFQKHLRKPRAGPAANAMWKELDKHLGSKDGRGKTARS